MEQVTRKFATLNQANAENNENEISVRNEHYQQQTFEKYKNDVNETRDSIITENWPSIAFLNSSNQSEEEMNNSKNTDCEKSSCDYFFKRCYFNYAWSII